jgi:hypothetical protein
MAMQTQEILYQTDARPSGSWRYRGELYEVRDGVWQLIFVTPRQYVSVEDARDAARGYIREFQVTGRTETHVNR